MKVNKSDIIVVGGGASGMVAAIMAARAGTSVTILEHMESLGKKILATGNGKCNYTNEEQGVDKYYGKDPAFVLPVLKQFGFAETIVFFRELGIYPKERNGCYYPQSGQAASVREVLRMELIRLKVNVVCNCGIRKIKRDEHGFIFDTKTDTYYAKKCILATGGKTLKASGSDGSGFLYLGEFGHHVIDIVPGLVGLKGKQAFFSEIAGIRAEILLDLYIENEKIKQETGELQLTSYGISGIPVFQISRLAAKALLEQKKVHVILDFAPFIGEKDFGVYLCEYFKKQKGKNIQQALIGLFAEKIIPIFLQLAGISAFSTASDCPKEDVLRLAEVIRNFRVDITDWNKFDSAQVTAGGVDTDEIYPKTMESRKVPGLYFAGEMVDIDGICGGYNLQWAWASGAVAGLSASKSFTTV